MTPSSAITTLFLDMAQVRPKEVVYIDNLPMFVEVAQGLHIPGIVHKDYATTRKALEAVGLSLRI